ncbi:hypothetical protein CHUAL_012890 [Chamberlinius hualienensis]
MLQSGDDSGRQHPKNDPPYPPPTPPPPSRRRYFHQYPLPHRDLVSPTSSGDHYTDLNQQWPHLPPTLRHTISVPAPPPPPPSSTLYNLQRQTSVPVSRAFPLDVHGTIHGEDAAVNRASLFQRSLSRTQTVKNYIRKSTAIFFGVDDENEEEQRKRWIERRKRMASKRYGQLKTEFLEDSESAVSEPSQQTSPSSGALAWTRQVSCDVPDGVQLRRYHHQAQAQPSLQPHPSLRHKESVVRLTWGGLSYIASAVARHRRTTLSSDSQSSVNRVVPTPTCSPNVPEMRETRLVSSYEDSVFEEPSDLMSPSLTPGDLSPGIEDDSLTEDVFYDRIPSPSPTVSTPSFPPSLLRHTRSKVFEGEHEITSDGNVAGRWRRSVTDPRIEAGREEEEELSVGMRRMWRRITDQLFDNSDRRQYGMGVVGRWLGRSFRKDRLPSQVKQQLDDLDDCRPFFTYWVTTVQILITIISLAVYGFGPIGFEQTERSGLVLVNSLSLQQVDYYEPDNFWIGPRAADLVHLGAKFAPCMRWDQNIFKAIETDRQQERNTACCIRNDNSGCVQTSRDECSATISTWKKWSFDNAGPGGRISGSVCGQDPSYCSDPPSAPPYSWPDDITKWPICRRKYRTDLSRVSLDHMACEVIGHPCCIGILGECKITTRDYCMFVNGYFHEEAALCSQVSCLDDICGMIPFYYPGVPDQVYRLWTSLFLHAGLVHLAVTIIVQFFLMRDLEKVTGAIRLCVIYMVSGVAGNLASAIFVPYRAEVFYFIFNRLVWTFQVCFEGDYCISGLLVIRRLVQPVRSLDY